MRPSDARFSGRACIQKPPQVYSPLLNTGDPRVAWNQPAEHLCTCILGNSSVLWTR